MFSIFEKKYYVLEEPFLLECSKTDNTFINRTFPVNKHSYQTATELRIDNVLNLITNEYNNDLSYTIGKILYKAKFSHDKEAILFYPEGIELEDIDIGNKFSDDDTFEFFQDMFEKISKTVAKYNISGIHIVYDRYGQKLFDIECTDKKITKISNEKIKLKLIVRDGLYHGFNVNNEAGIERDEVNKIIHKKYITLFNSKYINTTINGVKHGIHDSYIFHDEFKSMCDNISKYMTLSVQMNYVHYLRIQSTYENGKKNGSEKIYRENNVIYSSNYIDDKLDGECICKYDNGIIYINYKNGNVHGLCKLTDYVDDVGDIYDVYEKAEYVDNVCVKREKLVRRYGFNSWNITINDKKEGEYSIDTTYFQCGLYTVIDTICNMFEVPRKILECSFLPILTKTTYVNDIKNGLETIYEIKDDFAIKICTRYFKNDILDGKLTFYTGFRIITIPYKDGKIHGKCTITSAYNMFSRFVKELEINYADGELVGKYVYDDEFTRVEKEMISEHLVRRDIIRHKNGMISETNSSTDRDNMISHYKDTIIFKRVCETKTKYTETSYCSETICKKHGYSEYSICCSQAQILHPEKVIRIRTVDGTNIKTSEFKCDTKKI